ncbi:MAG: polymerase sigma factor RpoD [Verrucomicrobiota bacterium]|jgi:RNA polymerase primary sigma factor
MINNLPPTAKSDVVSPLTALLRSDLPPLGEIQVSVAEVRPDDAGEADSLTAFLNHANRWPRLEAEEELRLGRAIKAGKDEAGNLTPEAQAAFEELVNRNLRLSYHAAKQMRVPREEIMELVTAGNVALLHAARDFDADLGHRFSTYAFWGIRSAVMRELNFMRRVVRLPRNLHEQMSKLRKAEAALLQELGREPTEAEVSRVLGCDEEKVVELRAYQQHGQSLDAPISEESETTFGATLADEDALTPAAHAEATDRLEAQEEVLAQLTPRELEVIRLRFGLDGEELTLDAIGQLQGVSRERVRQIEAIALRKMHLGIRR